jgi:mannose-6-phosphate isomerase-like protein (cupin superfamily)
MIGFVQDMEGLAGRSEEFRRVLCSARCGQLVLMAVPPRGQTGAEVHDFDHFFRVESGAGEAVIDGVATAIRGGFAILVPAGSTHNLINTGEVPLTLYALDAPPHHRENPGHQPPAPAEADHEHFDHFEEGTVG